jgi:phosphoglycolate/pyridoxal phosphate phosphatase family enzyme
MQVFVTQYKRNVNNCFIKSSMLISVVLLGTLFIRMNGLQIYGVSRRYYRTATGRFRPRQVKYYEHSGKFRFASNVAGGSTATESMRVEAIEETQRLYNFYNSNDDDTACRPKVWTSRAEAAAFVRDEIDTVMFDCDGVLYRTLDQCPGVAECIRGLLHQNKTTLFVTNNAGVNRRELRDKLVNILQIESLENEQMISSSFSAAQYLKNELIQKKNGTSSSCRPRVHVIGSNGLCEELSNVGFEITGGPSASWGTPSMTREELEQYDFPEHPIDALVVGHDTAMSFRKLCIADNLLLRNPNALFVATNKDSFDLVGPDSRHIPGNGCTVQALEYSSKKAAINVGKPSQTLLDVIRDVNKGCLEDPSRCLFVGDRLDTDIRFAVDNGMKSLLVMTGVTTADKMIQLGNGSDDEPLPDFIAPFVSSQ